MKKKLVIALIALGVMTACGKQSSPSAVDLNMSDINGSADSNNEGDSTSKKVAVGDLTLEESSGSPSSVAESESVGEETGTDVAEGSSSESVREEAVADTSQEDIPESYIEESDCLTIQIGDRSFELPVTYDEFAETGYTVNSRVIETLEPGTVVECGLEKNTETSYNSVGGASVTLTNDGDNVLVVGLSVDATNTEIPIAIYGGITLSSTEEDIQKVYYILDEDEEGSERTYGYLVNGDGKSVKVDVKDGKVSNLRVTAQEDYM